MDIKILYKSLYHGEHQCGFFLLLLFEPKMYYYLFLHVLSLFSERRYGFWGKVESYFFVGMVFVLALYFVA